MSQSYEMVIESFFLLLTNLFYQLDPNEMIARMFLFFLARVAIFLTRFQKKTSLNLNTPFEVSSTLPETHSSPLKNGGRWETTFILGCHG